MTLPQLRALFFDMDGTLLDSFEAHCVAYERMFVHFGITLSREELLAVYAPDWYQTYRAVGLAEVYWPEANTIWMREAATVEAPWFEGVLELLTRLSATYRLGLVTAGSKPRVYDELGRAGLTNLFQTIITADDVTAPKPDPDGLNRALRQVGVQPHQALYIGDTLADWKTAQAAQMAFCGVRSGFTVGRRHHAFSLHHITEIEQWLAAG